MLSSLFASLGRTEWSEVSFRLNVREGIHFRGFAKQRRWKVSPIFDPYFFIRRGSTASPVDRNSVAPYIFPNIILGNDACFPGHSPKKNALQEAPKDFFALMQSASITKRGLFKGRQMRSSIAIAILLTSMLCIRKLQVTSGLARVELSTESSGFAFDGREIAISVRNFRNSKTSKHQFHQQEISNLF